MVYEFRDSEGRIVTASFPAAQAPQIGQVVELPGLGPCTRVLSQPAAVRGDGWKPYVSHRLPRNLKGVKCTPEGKPIIETRQQERNVLASLNMERE